MVIIDTEQLQSVLKAAIIEINNEIAKSNGKAERADKLYSINKVRIRLGKSHSTVKKAVKNGLIKTTADGQISESAINEYLRKN